MTGNYGRATLETVRRFEPRFIDGSQPNAGEHKIKIDDFNVIVSIEKNWLGIEIVGKVRMPNGSFRSVIYTEDTDLYKFDNPSNEDFIKSVEADIVAALNALAEHRMLVGVYKNRPAMVVPTSDKVVLVYQGRYLRGVRTLKRYPTLEKLTKDTDFKVV